ncbi:MAG: hypothetical protein WDO18_16295 [Acidobacteriota bacterium]
MTVAYVGSQGRNLFLRSWTNGITGVTTNPTTGAGNALLQFGPQFAQVDYKTSGGNDHYDSLQTTLNRRFSKGLTAGFQWTYGHSIGTTGGSNEAQTTQNPFDFKVDHGNNAFDVRHSANLSLLYQLPLKFQRRGIEALAGGWEVGGIMNARTGLPIDITIARPDLAYRVNSTGAFVASPIVTGRCGANHGRRQQSVWRRVPQQSPSGHRAGCRSVPQDGRRPLLPESGGVRHSAAGHFRQPGALCAAWSGIEPGGLHGS